jgi:CRISPR-associated protein Csa3
MQTFIGPLGYNETALSRPILQSGLQANDKVIPVRPGGEDERGDATITDLERLLTEIEPTVTVEESQVPHDDFEQAVRKAHELFQTSEGQVIGIIGGGAREIVLPVLVAATASADRLVETYTVADVDGQVRSITLPNLAVPIPRNAWSTLKSIARLQDEDGQVTVGDVSADTVASNSTVSKHVTKLEAAGALRSEKHGKYKILELTLSGELRLSAREDSIQE